MPPVLPTPPGAGPRALLATVLLLTLPGAAGAAIESRYEIEAAVADDLATVAGTVRIEVRNRGDAPLDALAVWLYPNVFADEPAGIDDANRAFYAPFSDPEGGISLEGIEVAARTAEAVDWSLAGTPPDTVRRLVLPAPLAPGAATTIELRFATRIPHRLGPLARARGVLTALGGWHPWVTAPPRDLDDRQPPPADWRVRLRIPDGHLALVGGAPLGPDGVIDLTRRAWVDLAVRPVDVRPVRTRGGAVWPLGNRPHDEWEKGSAPDPAPFDSEWVGDELAALLARLDRWADAQPHLPDPGPIPLVVVPLRSEIALATPGMVAVSDRAFAVTPFAVVTHIHARGVARAYFARRVLPAVERCEAPALARLIADGIGARLADRFVDEALGGAGDAREILGPFDFLPDVDDFLRSPRAPFAHVYFRPVADPIPVRDEPWTFNDRSRRGKLLFTKLEDWLGPDAFGALIDRYLAGEVCPLRAGAEALAGADLADFFRTWTGPLPGEDLRVQISSTERLPDGRWRSVVEVWRLGDAPQEVIETRATEAGGREHLLVWRAAAGEHLRRFEVVGEEPVERLQVDPRGRVAQTPADPTELAVRGDQVPERVQLLLTGFAVSYSTANDTFFGDVDVLLRPREAVRRRLGIGASYRQARLQGRTSLNFGFGRLVGAARYAWNWGIGLSADYLRAGFGGEEVAEGFAVGPAVRIAFDDRPIADAPLRGTAFEAGFSVSAGANRGGDSAIYGGLQTGALRLFPLGRRSALAVRIKGDLVLGDPPVQELLPLGGSDAALRGFPLEAALARERVIGSVEWRHPLIPDLDVDLGLARLRRVSGAAFADVAWAGRLHPLAPGTPRDAFFADAGYGLRFDYDVLGVRPLVLAVDAAVPVNRGAAVDVPPVVFSVRAGQAFSTP